MPGYAEPAGQWLGQKLAQLSGDVQALKAGQTEYIVDSEGVCRAIIGNLASTPKGESTGLTGFGIAVLVDSLWVELPGVGPWVGVENVSAKIEGGVAVRREMGANVRFTGAIKTTAEVPANTTIFTLPVGYRPSFNRFMPIAPISTASAPSLIVLSSGECQPNSNLSTGDYYGFDGITFSLTE
jgi:hypothetical protein